MLYTSVKWTLISQLPGWFSFYYTSVVDSPLLYSLFTGNLSHVQKNFAKTSFDHFIYTKFITKLGHLYQLSVWRRINSIKLILLIDSYLKSWFLQEPGCSHSRLSSECQTNLQPELLLRKRFPREIDLTASNASSNDPGESLRMEPCIWHLELRTRG